MTAIGIAIVRAIEADRPPAQRICFDPYARRFVNGGLYHLVRFFDRLGYSERKGPGVMGFLVARERHIDETLLACQYLTPEAVDSTLAFVAGQSAPGSSIIFDYAEP